MRKRLLTNPVRLTTIGWAVPISIGWIVGWIIGLAIKWPYSHFTNDAYWSGWLGGAIGISVGWAISGWVTGVALSQKYLSMKWIKMVMVGWVIALLIRGRI